MKTSSILVLGSVNLDFVVKGPRLPSPGETVIGGKFYQAPGGKGANQAVAAARAGRNPVTLLAAVGDDRFGREMREHFHRENLVSDYLKTVSGIATGVALILVGSDGENLISVASGANAHLSPEDVAAVPEAVFNAAGVFLTNLETPLETVSFGLRRAVNSNPITILNPAPASSLGASQSFLGESTSETGKRFSGIDVLTPNAIEAAMLTGIETATREGAIQAARQLQAEGCRAVVVTLGKQGCIVVEDDVTSIAAHEVTAVDSTGAGDAFNGALASALAEGASLAEASAWANLAAAFSVSRQGAQTSLATYEEIEAHDIPFAKDPLE